MTTPVFTSINKLILYDAAVDFNANFIKNHLAVHQRALYLHRLFPICSIIMNINDNALISIIQWVK